MANLEGVVNYLKKWGYSVKVRDCSTRHEKRTAIIYEHGIFNPMVYFEELNPKYSSDKDCAEQAANSFKRMTLQPHTLNEEELDEL